MVFCPRLVEDQVSSEKQEIVRQGPEPTPDPETGGMAEPEPAPLLVQIGCLAEKNASDEKTTEHKKYFNTKYAEKLKRNGRGKPFVNWPVVADHDAENRYAPDQVETG